jgi:membrane protease YdiL (CAAX protease family)
MIGVGGGGLVIFGGVDRLSIKLRSSPALARVVPFVIFLALTACQGQLGEGSRYWFYLAKTVAGAWLVWSVWPVVTEMRWALSWEAVVVGAGVFAMWVGLDGHYPSMDDLTQKFLCPLLKSVGLASWCPQPATAGLPWNPHLQFAGSAAMAWFFIGVRLAGSTFVVPPLEEVFYRSFIYRYIIKPDFEGVPLGRFQPLAFVLTSVLFGFEHGQWLAGILCGFAFQGLVCWKGRLGDAMTAHALTNLLLGLWVIWKGAWNFW